MLVMGLLTATLNEAYKKSIQVQYEKSVYPFTVMEGALVLVYD
jgi:hypothetical protein